MPLPLLAVLGLGVLGYLALNSSNDSGPSDTPDFPGADDTPPTPDTPADSTDENPDPPMPRSDDYDQFQTAYATSDYHNIIAESETDQGIPGDMLARLIFTESRFNADVGTSSTGDVGIAQLQPGTASDLGVVDPNDPAQAIPGAARYLAWLKDQTGSWRSALIAYNWGIGNVQKFGVDRAPKAARQYADSILADSQLS